MQKSPGDSSNFSRSIGSVRMFYMYNNPVRYYWADEGVADYILEENRIIILVELEMV